MKSCFFTGRKEILFKVLIIAAFCILLILAAAIALVNRPAPQDERANILNRMENALGDAWKKETITKVSDFVYSDNDGNIIIFHICTTTYYEADATKQTGLNIDAITAVIAPDDAESCRECTVSGRPAAIYQKDGRAYLCWTITPELSCVIEYDPMSESEDDMLRMAESVPADTAPADNP